MASCSLLSLSPNWFECASLIFFIMEEVFLFLAILVCSKPPDISCFPLSLSGVVDTVYYLDTFLQDVIEIVNLIPDFSCVILGSFFVLGHEPLLEG